MNNHNIIYSKEPKRQLQFFFCAPILYKQINYTIKNGYTISSLPTPLELLQLTTAQL